MSNAARSNNESTDASRPAPGRSPDRQPAETAGPGSHALETRTNQPVSSQQPGSFPAHGRSGSLRVYVKTFGCQMNVYDSGKILALLEKDHYLPTRNMEDADLILVNTCSVREKPEHKLRSFLGVVKRLQKKRRAVCGVVGCMAQHDGARIFADHPYLDLVLGPDALPYIRRHLREARNHRVLDRRFLEVADYPFVEDIATSPQAAPGPCALVTVQKGCDNHCTYCIVPSTRGKEQSRPWQQVLGEARRLVARGVKDITLIGQNVNAYGRKRRDGVDFVDLLHMLQRLDGLERIRFTTSHPKDVDQRFIQAFAELPRLASHLHLPVQSGSNRILRRMGRGCTRERFLDIVAALRRARPDISITTDLIVGFPGETEDDFRQTLDLMEQVPLDGSFSFKYSPRPHTAATRLPPEQSVPAHVSSQRLARLQALQRELSIAANRRLQGRVLSVLIEGPSRRDPAIASGRTSCFRTVNVHAPGSEPGSIVQVEITRTHANSLEGRVLGT